MYIACGYTTQHLSEFELPEGRTPQDIQDFWVKWNMIYITWTDGTEYETELDFLEEDADIKRPMRASLMEEDEEYEGYPNWGEPLLEKEF